MRRARVNYIINLFLLLTSCFRLPSPTSSPTQPAIAAPGSKLPIAENGIISIFNNRPEQVHFKFPRALKGSNVTNTLFAPLGEGG